MQVGDPVVTLASLEGSLGSRGAGGFKTGSSFRFIPLFYARTNWISQSKSYVQLKQQSRGGSEPRSEHLLFLPSLPDPGFTVRESVKTLKNSNTRVLLGLAFPDMSYGMGWDSKGH